MGDEDLVVRRRGDTAVIDLRGEIDSKAERALGSAYAKATGNGTGSVILNFAGADYMNSTGIALIVGLLAQARAHGVKIAACGLSDHYREIFEITRLADFITITDTEGGTANAGDGRDDA